MQLYELHPPQILNVAALPYESQNTKNVRLQRGIARCIIASPKWTRVIMCLKFTYRPIKLNLLMNVIQQSLHETKIRDIHNLRKCLMQTCFDFDRNIINAG